MDDHSTVEVGKAVEFPWMNCAFIVCILLTIGTDFSGIIVAQLTQLHLFIYSCHIQPVFGTASLVKTGPSPLPELPLHWHP